MPINHQREATFGMLTYLLVGASVAVTILLGSILVGTEAVRDALSGAALHTWIRSGEAFLTYTTAFLVFLPFAVLGIAAVMGRRAATTGNDVGGQAALTTLFGVIVAWVSVSAALLLASAVIGVEGTNSAFAEVSDLVLEGFLYIGLAMLPLLGLAAVTARFVRSAFIATDDLVPMARAMPMGGGGAGVASAGFDAAMDDEPASAWPGVTVEHGGLREDHGRMMMEVPSTALFEHPVDCPRCNANFTVSGDRPLRIECPECGKTGTVR